MVRRIEYLDILQLTDCDITRLSNAPFKANPAFAQVRVLPLISFCIEDETQQKALRETGAFLPEPLPTWHDFA